MPFEAVSCPSCGSLDVQEVKPGTYFCNHSETVFKYIDPSRLAASYAPSFCMHGNPVRCQWQLCGAGMCMLCDVIQWQATDGAPDSVPTVGFGYLKHLDERERRVAGPFFYIYKLISSLASSRGDLRHVCYPCVASAVPVTADRIITGVVCESPLCGAPSRARCRCCGSAFCEQCLTPKWLTYEWFHKQELARLSDPYRRYRYYPGVPSYWPCLPVICMSPGASPDRIGWAPPDNLCQACVGENVEEAAKLSKKMCEGFPELLPGNEVRVSDDFDITRLPDKFLGATVAYEFCVSGGKPLSSRRQQRERARTYEIAQRCAAEVTERLQEEMAGILVSGGCARQRAFGEKKLYATYAILDERDRIGPAAAPEATGAR